MNWQLTLTTKNVKKYNVLDSETPLSGVAFFDAACACLRRSLDTVPRNRHQTLGTLATYTVNVPGQLAYQSGLFEDTSMIVVTASEDILKNFIFYGASLGNVGSNRPCYPYTVNEVVLTSYIDELGFLGQWAGIGYPTMVTVNESGNLIPWDGGEAEDDANHGMGCGGCPVNPDRPFPPFPGRPGGDPPKKPDDWFQPGPNTPHYPVPPNQPPFPAVPNAYPYYPPQPPHQHMHGYPTGMEGADYLGK